MKQTALLLILLFTAAFPILAQDSVQCAGSPEPRLEVGDTGRIAQVFSTLRTSPAGFPIRVMFSPATFQVLEGPLCAGYGPLTWYRIQYENGATGWASEGQVRSKWGNNLYWLESADGSVFNPTAPVTPAPTDQTGTPVQPGTASSIKITEPLADAIVTTDQPITIRGTGAGLFENNVVVRLVDDQSNVIIEQPTVLSATGDWEIITPVSVPAGTHGVIVAYSPSPVDGSVTTLDIINVIFGISTAEPNFVKIGSPQTATGIPLDQPIVIAGVADPRNGNIVRLEIIDDSGNLLLQQPVEILPSAQGDFGTWEITVEIHGQAVGTQLQISAMTASSFDSPALANDSIGVVVVAA